MEHGLHARPASVIQEIARQYDSSITWENKRSGLQADCKSPLALIASDTWLNDPCEITISGQDEIQAESALNDFMCNQFHMCGSDPANLETIPTTTQSLKLPHILQTSDSLFFTGTSACKGIVKANAFILDSSCLEPPPSPESPVVIETEIKQLKLAIDEVSEQMMAQFNGAGNKTEKEIINAHISILQDSSYLEKIEGFISADNHSAPHAVFQTALHFSHILQNSKSLYIRQRLADIKDISARIISQLIGSLDTQTEVCLPGPVIVVAESLMPSRFISLDKKLIKGIVLAEGGTTSHTVILARAFNIPTVTGIEAVHKKLNNGEPLILDATRGIVIPEHNGVITRFYDNQIIKQQKSLEFTRPFVFSSGMTADNKMIEIGANIGSAEELEGAIGNGAEGIGLFRTELLFMNRTEAPSEDEQFEVYSNAAKIAGDRPVIIRTLDIGGDKPISFIEMPKEENPFLGCRAIRLYNDYPSLFESQIRAILRASVFGNLKIMFPMIACYEEIMDLKSRLDSIKIQLEKEGIPFNPHIEVGIMVEIPSVAFLMDKISPIVDFFSIGSNDLSQYFFAADRTNPRVSYLYNSLYPQFVRLLNQIISQAHAHSKPVGICGEMGGQLHYLPVLVGLGFDEISLSSPNIPALKTSLRKLNSDSCKDLVVRLMEQSTVREVEEELLKFSQNQPPVHLIGEESINLASESLSREEAIRELVDMLEISGRIENSDTVEESIWQREAVYSTGIGFGVAIPHCQSAYVTHNSISLLKLKKPIDWQSLDNDPVDIVILLSIRSSDHDKEHLKILARLSRKLMDDEFRDDLRKAESASVVINLINQCI